MCYYCELEFYEKSHLDCEYNKSVDLGEELFKYTSLKMAYSDEAKQFALVAEGDDENIVPINYCPMCGRKLVENE